MGFAIFAAIFAVIGGIIYGVAHLGHPYCQDCPSQGSASTYVTPSARVPASPATGLAFARQLLADVLLPPGAQDATPSPALQVEPGSMWVSTRTVDTDRVWRVPMPAAAVVAFFKDHPPPGTRDGGFVLPLFAGVTLTALYYPVTAVPPQLAREQVIVVVDPIGPQASLIRVDAQAAL
jgi:hypothetical protein